MLDYDLKNYTLVAIASSVVFMLSISCGTESETKIATPQPAWSILSLRAGGEWYVGRPDE